MFELSESLKSLASEIIASHSNLAPLANGECRIAYMWCDTEKKRNGKAVYADTEKVSDKVKTVAGVDFVITFYRPNCAGLNDDKKRILMYHELRHVGFEPGGSCRIIPHDVEDFEDIITDHGMNWVI